MTRAVAAFLGTLVLAGSCRSTSPWPAAAAPVAARFRVLGVARWRGDATAAFTLIHDDVCEPRTAGIFSHADPELTRRGLHAGFAAIVGTCEARHLWNSVNTLVAHGHEVFNHSWSHPCLGPAADCTGNGTPSQDLAQELVRADEVLRARTGLGVQYMIFPYDVCGADGVALIKKMGYLGDRCGEHGVAPPDFADPFAAPFDMWGPSYSIYTNKGPCTGIGGEQGDNEQPSSLPHACRAYTMRQYIDDTIARQGWGNREMHGFDPDDVPAGGWQTVTLADYTLQLDYLKAKVDAGQLWVEGPTRVIRYRFARESCALPAVTGDRLHFTESAACKKYDTTLSYLVATADGSDTAKLVVRQGAVVTPAKKLGPGRFLADADPGLGDAVLVAD